VATKTSGKCGNCGESVTLEPDSNGGLRWYHSVEGSGNGDDFAAYCADGGTITLAADDGAAVDDTEDEGGN